MTSRARRKLPIGIQTFRQIREGGYYYVDKTGYLRKLLDEGKHYFLSRPRRFGKSLLVDTISELFEGGEALFRGLDIHDKWDWSAPNPVLRLSFSGGNFREPGALRASLMAQLDSVARRSGVASRYDTGPERFAALVEALRRKAGRPVAVLVDEYDKPILDALDAPDVARANRDFLRGVYGVVKDADADIRFSFFTGVSKFSKVSLFSGLNNLIDITLEPAFSAVCGYTDRDLDTVFAPELDGLDRDAIRDWYNGYRWLGEEVYNPFDILLLFRRRKFGAYWFETGTPTFLLETLFNRRVSSVELGGMIGSSELLSTFDVDDMATEALLFQTGYLTITGESDLERGGAVPAGLSQPRSAPEPEPEPAALPGQGRDPPDGEQRSAARVACEERLRGTRGPVPGVLFEHPLRMVHEQRHRRLRGLLRERVLLVLCGAGAGHHGGGQ